MKKFFLKVFAVLILLYILISSVAYFFQEKLLFLPEKLNAQHSFQFKSSYEEVWLNSNDSTAIHGLHFRVQQPKGVIYFLHGNGGSLDRWGIAGDIYTQANYDVFMIDYRSYGKSQGNISNLDQLFADCQLAYDHLKKIYPESQIHIFGYSLGTGLAAKTAANNNPAKLVLHAPYFSIKDMMQQRFPFLPSFLLKYNINTNEYLKNVKSHVYIFHGMNDYVIPIAQSEKIIRETDYKINFIKLDRQGHNGILENFDYLIKMDSILRR